MAGDTSRSIPKIPHPPDRSGRKLYIVPLPIGNLKDITLRAVEVLRSVDVIFCEDTRRTLKILNHLEIKKRLVSYYKPREQEKLGTIMRILRTQVGALVTDSGTPLISDPGLLLVQRALDERIDILPLPGPSAFLPALVASGINGRSFLFLGFPPRARGELSRYLKRLSQFPFTLVFYESPRRVKAFLETARSVLGNRRFCLAKEISKKNERMIRGELEQLDEIFQDEVLLGEMVVVLEGGREGETRTEAPDLQTLDDIYSYFLETHNISKNKIKSIFMKRERGSESRAGTQTARKGKSG